MNQRIATTVKKATVVQARNWCDSLQMVTRIRQPRQIASIAQPHLTASTVQPHQNMNQFQPHLFPHQKVQQRLGATHVTTSWTFVHVNDHGHHPSITTPARSVKENTATA